jgi:ABC-type amino acid transport substrate-binding protein
VFRQPPRTGPVAGAPWSATSYPMTPYGPMYRKDDPAFAAVVDRTFARLGETRRILQIYGRWFLDRLPTGERLGRPTAPQLETMFRTPACRE